jgi:SSS family solute:Na+ symporter
LGSFVFFTGLVGLLTWNLTRRRGLDTATEYFLAGRSLTGGYIAGSLLLTNLSTEQLVGLNGAAFTDGICVMAWEVIAGASLVIMALFFLPRYLKSGIATVPQFLELRFNHRTRTITSLIFIVAYAAILLPIILYTGAKGLTGILDMRQLTGIESEWGIIWLAVWLIGLIGSLYAIVGGLRSVAVSDTLNGFGLLTGGVLITWLGLSRVGGGDPFVGLKTLQTSHPEHFNSVGGPSSSVPFSTLFTGVLLLNLFYWCTNQQIIQRAFAASSLREGQRGVLIAGIFKVLAPLILVLPGIIAFHLYAEEGLKRDDAYGTLVRDVLPAPLAGFFAAVMVGAILSSFNSVLNSTATLFSLGVYKDLLHPEASDAQVIHAGKVCGWIVAVASMTAAPFLLGQDSIFAYLQKMNGLYFIPIFSVVLVGMLNRRVPSGAANAALVIGFLVIAAGYFVPALSKRVEQIHEFHFLGGVFITLVLGMLAAAVIAPRETPWQQEYTRDVDLTPWPLAWPVGLGLLAVVFGIYARFADFSVLP